SVLNAVGRRPKIRINDASVVEGNGASAVFTVSLGTSSTETITVNYGTGDGTAKAGTDYTAVSGTLTFSPGQTRKTISVPILVDSLQDLSESFFVVLSGPTDATIVRARGRGLIVQKKRRGTL